MLAPENAFAISAPNAGPPVTWTRSGRASRGEPSRSALTASLSAKPDRLASSGAACHAALPSCDDDRSGHRCFDRGGQVGRSEGSPSAPGDDEDDRRRLTAGELRRSASAPADSALVGSGTGDCWPESSPPTTTNSAADARDDQGERPMKRPVTARRAAPARSQYFRYLTINQLK